MRAHAAAMRLLPVTDVEAERRLTFKAAAPSASDSSGGAAIAAAAVAVAVAVATAAAIVDCSVSGAFDSDGDDDDVFSRPVDARGGGGGGVAAMITRGNPFLASPLTWGRRRVACGAISRAAHLCSRTIRWRPAPSYDRCSPCAGCFRRPWAARGSRTWTQSSCLHLPSHHPYLSRSDPRISL